MFNSAIEYVQVFLVRKKKKKCKKYTLICIHCAGALLLLYLFIYRKNMYFILSKYYNMYMYTCFMHVGRY